MVSEATAMVSRKDAGVPDGPDALLVESDLDMRERRELGFAPQRWVNTSRPSTGNSGISTSGRSSAPKVRHPLRNCYLLSGPHSAYTDFPDQPNYWWPEDQPWCVRTDTDTDFDWPYLAGPVACIEEVTAIPLLDAYRTKPENPAP